MSKSGKWMQVSAVTVNCILARKTILQARINLKSLRLSLKNLEKKKERPDAAEWKSNFISKKDIWD